MPVINDDLAGLEIDLIGFVVGDGGVFLDNVFPGRLQLVAACKTIMGQVCERRLV
jgi:hypothetical protein